MEILLTPSRPRRRVVLMQDALKIVISQAIGSRSVQEAADACGLPYHHLADIIYGRTKRPKPDVLEAIERGLGVPYDRLALAAYGRLTEPQVAEMPA